MILVRITCGGLAPTDRGGLDGLLDLAGLEALRAHVGTLRLALQEDAHSLEIRVEAPLRGDHRMAPVVAETGLLSTDCADPGHRRGGVGKSPYLVVSSGGGGGRESPPPSPAPPP